MAPQRAALVPGAAWRFVLLLGLVSLFADMTSEGARSISGPFLAELGASATIVGVVAGFGELIGYGLRLVSGYLADRSRRYWAGKKASSFCIRAAEKAFSLPSCR